MIQLAQGPVVDEDAGGFRFVEEGRKHLDGEFFAVLAGGLHHGFGIDICAGHGFFAVHVFAGGQSRDGDGRV